jgi:hypothetical protein
MATKKNPLKPPAAMMDDLQKVFSKHNWKGSLILKPTAALGESQCPPGQTPHEISYQLPDGTWVTETKCM